MMPLLGYLFGALFALLIGAIVYAAIAADHDGY